MVWKQVRDQEGRCEFRTKDDAVLVGRNWKEGGGVQLERRTRGCTLMTHR
jgi:hypothetical protein